MNPSYNNGVGSQIPQNMPQGGASQGIPQSGVPQGVVPGGVPQGVSQQPIISSGAGDVMLSGSEPKKSRKGVIALIVLVVILALAGGGFLLWQNGMFGGKGNMGFSQQVTGLQAAYNNYVNYVLWGVESDGQPDLAAMEEAVPYFQNLQGDDELGTYISKADEKYAVLKQTYDESVIENKIDISALRLYFEEYAKINVSEEEVLNTYLKGGQEAANELIEAGYENGKSNESLAKYSEANRDYMKLFLQMIVEKDAKGCIKGGEIVSDCGIMTEEENTKLEDSRHAALSERVDIKAAALLVIDDLYVELYGENVEEGA